MPLIPPTSLASERLRAEILSAGPITFARFMERALYDDEFGYYLHHVPNVGPDGDFITSPEAHPAFGACVCVQLVEMWCRLERPHPFLLVEAGPGRGVLARDILTTAQSEFPDFAAAIHVLLIERSPALRQVQADLLGPWGEQVTWLGSDAGAWAPLGTGCVLANELVDAFPVHRVIMTTAGLREQYVACDGARLQLELGPVSTPAIAEQVAAGGARLSEGCWAEVNLAAPVWVRQAAYLLARGYWLFLDYGAPAVDLYRPTHPRGTLRSYHRHILTEDVLTRIGQQDITAHIDFSAICRAAEAEGLDLLGATRQSQFLERLGLAERLDRRVSSRRAQWAGARGFRRLTNPHGLGGILVAAFGRGISPSALRGFQPPVP